MTTAVLEHEFTPTTVMGRPLGSVTREYFLRQIPPQAGGIPTYKRTDLRRNCREIGSGRGVSPLGTVRVCAVDGPVPCLGYPFPRFGKRFDDLL